MTQAAISNHSAPVEKTRASERRPRMTELSEGGQKLLSALTILFIGVLAALTWAAVQIFDGWHHLIVIADIVIIFLAIAAWIYSTRGDD